MTDDPRLCHIRILIPAKEVHSPLPTWSDVAFTYVRELHKYVVTDVLHGEDDPLPLIKLIPHDGAVDLRVESRWYPFGSWFLGNTPDPGPRGGRPTFVNVVIGAGSAVDEMYTPGAINILITGHSIPPHKLNWMSEKIWHYHQILTLSQKHSVVIDEEREKAYQRAKEYVQTGGQDPASLRLVSLPLTMTLVVPPVSGIQQFVDILKAALRQCEDGTRSSQEPLPESEKHHGKEEV